MKLSKKIWVVVGGAFSPVRVDGSGVATLSVSAHSTKKAAIEAAISEDEHALSYQGDHHVVELEVNGEYELVTVEYDQVKTS